MCILNDRTVDSSRFWSGMMVFWAFLKTNIHFEERELDRGMANRHAELVFGKSAA